MEPDFWHERWQNSQIGFHESAVNPTLVKQLPVLELADGARMFVPLCGKTLDIGWLLSQGYRVVGIELSQLAVEQLFTELGVEPAIEDVGQLSRYSAAGVDIFVGDIFNLSQDVLGSVDAVYDRAALVALPESMRNRYTAHLSAITKGAAQLLITFEYDQQLMKGPPFSVPNEEVHQHYDSQYEVVSQSSAPLEGGLKGQVPATANVWLLRARSVAPVAS